MRIGRRNSRLRYLAIWLVLIAILAGITHISRSLIPPGKPFSGSAVAVDGDTLRMRVGRVRLLGIDAPEIGQTCRRDNADWPCGIAARSEMAHLLAAGLAHCTPRGRDTYGRVLAHCQVDGVDLSASMVAAGLAVSRDGYGSQQAAAKKARKGMWAGSFADPRDWRDGHARAGTQHSPIDMVRGWLHR